MAKNDFEVVTSPEDIRCNIQEYLRILDAEKDAVVIQRFASFDYWYYFSELSIFVPNKFLGYKTSASEYNPTSGNGQNGSIAKDALKDYFQLVDEEYYEDYLSELESFAKLFRRGIKKNKKNGEKIDIFEPKEKYRKILTDGIEPFSGDGIYIPRDDITIEKVIGLYSVVKEMLRSEFDKNTGIKKCQKVYGWKNSNTVSRYIDSIERLIKNKKHYASTMSVEATEYILEQIHNDFDENIFRNALYTLKGHIVYLKEKNGSTYAKPIYEKLLKKYKIEDINIQYSDLDINERDTLNNKKSSSKISQEQKPKVKQSILIKKSNQFVQNVATQKEEDLPELYVKRCMDFINEINKICTRNGKRRMFKLEVFELQRKIENLCNSENDFIVFALNLYKILRETTRYDNQNKKPPFDYMLPDEFMKNGTLTRCFWEEVNTFRGETAHIEKGKIADLFEKYLGKNNRTEPKTAEGWQRLQIGVLQQFEKTVTALFQIIETNPNCLK